MCPLIHVGQLLINVKSYFIHIHSHPSPIPTSGVLYSKFQISSHVSLVKFYLNGNVIGAIGQREKWGREHGNNTKTPAKCSEISCFYFTPSRWNHVSFIHFYSSQYLIYIFDNDYDDDNFAKMCSK